MKTNYPASYKISIRSAPVIWIKDLEKKLTNMKRALDLKPKDAPVKVFLDGISIGGANSYNKGSSVDETE